MSHLVRRLIELWLSGEVNAGKPSPIRTRSQKNAIVFRISNELRVRFNAQAHGAGWRSSALIRKLLDLWYDDLISVGTSERSGDRTMLVDGKEVTYYTLDEASRILGVCTLTLRKRIKRECGIKGKRLLITQDEIEIIKTQLAK